MRTQFSNLMPDQPSLDNGGLQTANNCIPYERSYGPFPEPAVSAGSLSAECRGAFSGLDTSGAVTNFAGTQTKLWKLATASWSDATRAVGGDYDIGTEGMWEFVTVQDTVIAVGGNVNQIWSLGSSTKFATLSGSAPLMSHITVVRDFAVGGNIVGAPNRVQWSAIGNPLDWNVSATTESDYQDLIGDNSAVQKVLGGEFGVVLTGGSVWRMSYVGSPLVFQFDRIETGIGCLASGSAIRHFGMTFFLSDQGFFATDGQQVVPIGDGMIDRTFLDELDGNYLHKVSATIDPFNKLYLVAYPGSGNNGIPNRIIAYNFVTKRWATADQTLEYLYSRLTEGYTLEGLDAISTSLDSLPASLDSRQWVGGLKLLAGFDSSHRLLSFNSGMYKDARFETGEAQLTTDRRSFIRAVTPLVEGNSSTVISARVGQRETLTDAVSYTTSSARNAQGRCPLRANGTYQRLRIDVSGGFTHAYGADIEVAPNGVR